MELHKLSMWNVGAFLEKNAIQRIIAGVNLNFSDANQMCFCSICSIVGDVESAVRPFGRIQSTKIMA